MNRREFVLIAAALGSACTRYGGSVIANDGRLTARPREGVRTTATGEIRLGLDSDRDAILWLPQSALGLINGDLFSSVVAFSPGFVIDGAPHSKPRIFISHGANDRILPIDRCGRRIASGLKALGYDVTFREFDGDHEIPGDIVREGLRFL